MMEGMVALLFNPVTIFGLLFLAFGIKNLKQRHYGSAITYFVLSVVIVVAAGLLIAVVAQERADAKLTSTLSNGRGIFTVLFAEDSYQFTSEPYPSTAVYSNSTQYFLAMVEHGPLHVDLSFFSTAFQEPKLIKYAYAFEQATQLRKPPKFIETFSSKN